MPLSLVPHTVFDTPVKLFIPVPEEADIFSMGLAYHDGTQWLLAADADGNVVQGNYIGTGAAGNGDLGNQSHGVRIESATNQIGGTQSGARNVIACNDQSGIYILGDGTGNTVKGNYIGTDAAGSNAAGFGNTASGIRIETANNVIGGMTAAARNVLSGNDLHGVSILGAGATGNIVRGNYIGLYSTVNGADIDGNTVVQVIQREHCLDDMR